jgi:hypothetical protein
VGPAGSGNAGPITLDQRELGAGTFRDAPRAAFALEALDLREKTGAAITAAETIKTAMSTNRFFLLAMLWVVFRVLILRVLLRSVPGP